MRVRAHFDSHFSRRIRDMVAHKKALGYSPKSYECHLWPFNDYCVAHFPDETELTKELVTSWAAAKPGETINGRNRRLAAIREFGRYLQSIGQPAYVFPPKMSAKSTRFVPHLYTDTELKAFFRGADHCGKKQVPMLHYIVPVIFRLIYCCGLRPDEGRTIKLAALDIQTGKLYIRQSKRHKDRAVMLTGELLQLCATYLSVRSRLGVQSEFLFPNGKGQAYSCQWLHDRFKECWKIAGVPIPQGSRIYDFRHTFATRRLHDWLDQGEDLYFWLPYLSAYMGHSHFSSTAYYIHMLPERLTNSPAIDWKAFADLLPEVSG